MPQIYLNYFSDNRANITYEPSTDKDLQKCKPVFCTQEELERIKNCTVEQVFKILEDNKF